MLRAFALGLVVITAAPACSKSPPDPDRCERVAHRLMPSPDPQFLASCRAQLDDPAFVRMLDCILAIPGEIYDDKPIKACSGSATLPPYFQF